MMAVQQLLLGFLSLNFSEALQKFFFYILLNGGNPHKNVSERCPIPFGDCSTGNYCHQAHDLIIKKLYII